MEMSGKILVTGANGFLAVNVINALLAACCQVRGILRRKGSYQGAVSESLELYEGDFTDETVLPDAMSGCSAVVHCAACTDQSASEEEYRRVNVDAVKNLLEAAAVAGIGRVVNISSANIFGYGTKESPGDESSPVRFPFTESGYAMSKAGAQKVVDSFRDRLEVITLCPTFMLGPYGSPAGSCRIVSMGYRRRLVFCPPGGKNFVAVQDVAAAAVAALTEGIPGEAYLLTGENLSYREFYRLLSERTGCRSVRISLPSALLLSLGRAGDLLAALGMKTELSTVNMRLLCTGNYYSSSKAAEDLGFRCRRISDAVDETVAWLLHTGKLK